MEPTFVIAQIFGLLASVALIASVQFKKKSNILIMMMTNSVFFTVGFILLGAWSGAMICAVSAVVSLAIFLIEKFDRKVTWPIAVILAIVEIAFWALTYKSAIDVIPLVGTLFWLASMLQRDANRLRYLIMVNFVSWIIYGIVTKAYTSTLADFFSIVSTIIALIRYRDVKQKKRVLK